MALRAYGKANTSALQANWMLPARVSVFNDTLWHTNISTAQKQNNQICTFDYSDNLLC